MIKRILFLVLLTSFWLSPEVPDDSDYTTHKPYFSLKDAVNDTLGQPRMILCFMSKLRPDLMVSRQGQDYLALVDQAACDEAGQVSSGPQSQGGAASSSSNSQSAAISYTEVVVNAARASSADPMVVKAWVPQTDMGESMTIYTYTEATAGASDDAPFGEFLMRFTGTTDESKQDFFKGYLQASGSSLFYSEEFNDSWSGQVLESKAVINLGEGETGSGAVEGYVFDSMGELRTRTDVFAYNEEAFCRKKVSENGSEVDGQEKCYSTDESLGTKEVFGYFLYDSTTGERFDLPNKGFRVTYNGQYGFADGYGIHFDESTSNNLTSGITVQRDDDDPAFNGKEYTTYFLGGKLRKIEVQRRSLQSLDGLSFLAFMNSDQSLGISEPAEYKLNYTDANNTFTITHKFGCDERGCYDQVLDTEISFTVTEYLSDQTRWGIFGYMPGVGGLGISLDAMQDPESALVTSEIESEVSPADFPAQLYCVENCPTYSNIQALLSSLADSGQANSSGPYSNYNSFGISSSDVVTYSLNEETNVYGAGDGDAVFSLSLSDDEKSLLQQTEFGFGAYSGPLVATLSDLTCDIDGYDYCTSPVYNGAVTEYYQWVTSPDRWNQYRGLVDNTGKLVNFSKPVSLYFNVPSDATKYQEFAGKELRLEFGGGDQLWGIPGGCVTDGVFTDNCFDTDSDNVSGYLPWVDKFRIPATSTEGRLYKNPGAAGDYYLAKPAFGVVILKRNNAYRGTLTLGSVDDLPSLEIVNIGPNGGENFIGLSPNKPSTVSIVHGLTAAEAAAFASEGSDDTGTTDPGSSAPIFQSSTTLNVEENSTVVGTVVATDPDGDTVSYSLSGFKSSGFSIDSTSGVLSFLTAPDYEAKTQYTVTVVASDGANSTNQVITVNIIDVDDKAPIITSSRWFNANGTDIGTVTAIDADSDTITFSVTDTEIITINESSGVLSFSTSPTESSYAAKVIASDGTNSTSQLITVFASGGGSGGGEGGGSGGGEGGGSGGGSGGEGSIPNEYGDDTVCLSDNCTKFDGKAIDGYIVGAKVFIDQNFNFKWDAGELIATTDSDGLFSIPLNDDDLYQCLIKRPIVVDVPVGAFDTTRGEVEQAYQMLLPSISDAGSNQIVISPFTTLLGSAVSKGKADANITQDLTVPEGCSSTADTIAQNISSEVSQTVSALETSLGVTYDQIQSDFLENTDNQLITESAAQNIANFFPYFKNAADQFDLELSQEFGIDINTNLTIKKEAIESIIRDGASSEIDLDFYAVYTETPNELGWYAEESIDAKGAQISASGALQHGACFTSDENCITSEFDLDNIRDASTRFFKNSAIKNNSFTLDNDTWELSYEDSQIVYYNVDGSLRDRTCIRQNWLYLTQVENEQYRSRNDRYNTGLSGGHTIDSCDQPFTSDVNELFMSLVDTYETDISYEEFEVRLQNSSFSNSKFLTNKIDKIYENRDTLDVAPLITEIKQIPRTYKDINRIRARIDPTSNDQVSIYWTKRDPETRNTTEFISIAVKADPAEDSAQYSTCVFSESGGECSVQSETTGQDARDAFFQTVNDNSTGFNGESYIGDAPASQILINFADTYRVTENNPFATSGEITALNGATLNVEVSGEDTELFSFGESASSSFNLGADAKDYETPIDDDGDNIYKLTVTATEVSASSSSKASNDAKTYSEDLMQSSKTISLYIDNFDEDLIDLQLTFNNSTQEGVAPSVEVSAVTDKLTYASEVQVQIRNRDGGRDTWIYVNNKSEGAFKDTFTNTQILPLGLASGTYDLSRVRIVRTTDNGGDLYLTNSQVAEKELDVAWTLENVNTDSEAPDLIGYALEQETAEFSWSELASPVIRVQTTVYDAAGSLDTTMTDPAQELQGGYMHGSTDGNDDARQASVWDWALIVSGTDGYTSTYLHEFYLHPKTKNGTYNFCQPRLYDLNGNGKIFSKADIDELGADCEFVIDNPIADNQKPILENFSIVPSVAEDGRKNIRAVLDITSDESGIRKVFLKLNPVQGELNYYPYISYNTYDGNQNQSIPESQTEFVYSIDIAKEIADTTYEIEFIEITDGALNISKYYPADLQALDFDTEVTFNDAPIIATTAFTIDENTSAVGNISATDPEGSSLTYSVSGDDSSLVEIDSSGNITLASAADYETKTTYSFNITASDGDKTTTASITISINNLNDNDPQITSSATASIYETTTIVGTLTATDADGDDVTLSISGTDAAEFSFADNVLTLLSEADYETKDSYALTLIATDGERSSTQNITVTILDTAETVQTEAGSGEYLFYGTSIDGYIIGAEVTIDQNFNFKKDDGELTTTTQAGGQFAIVTEDEDLYNCLVNRPIIVDVPVGAGDSTRGVVSSAFQMILPSISDTGATEIVVTPFSSLLSEAVLQGKSDAGIKEDLTVAEGCSSEGDSVASSISSRLSTLQTSIENNFGISLDNLLSDFLENPYEGVNINVAQNIANYFPSIKRIDDVISEYLSDRFDKTIRSNASLHSDSLSTIFSGEYFGQVPLNFQSIYTTSANSGGWYQEEVIKAENGQMSDSGILFREHCSETDTVYCNVNESLGISLENIANTATSYERNSSFINNSVQLNSSINSGSLYVTARDARSWRNNSENWQEPNSRDRECQLDNQIRFRNDDGQEFQYSSYTQGYGEEDCSVVRHYYYPTLTVSSFDDSGESIQLSYYVPDIVRSGIIENAPYDFIKKQLTLDPTDVINDMSELPSMFSQIQTIRRMFNVDEYVLFQFFKTSDITYQFEFDTNPRNDYYNLRDCSDGCENLETLYGQAARDKMFEVLSNEANWSSTVGSSAPESNVLGRLSEPYIEIIDYNETTGASRSYDVYSTYDKTTKTLDLSLNGAEIDLENIQNFLTNGIGDSPLDAKIYINPDNAISGTMPVKLSLYQGNDGTADVGEDYFTIEFNLDVSASSDGLIFKLLAGEDIVAKYITGTTVISRTITNANLDQIVVTDGALSQPDTLNLKILTLLSTVSDVIDGIQDFFSDGGTYFFKVDLGSSFSIVDFYRNTVDYIQGTFVTKSQPTSGIFVRDIKISEGNTGNLCFTRIADGDLTATSFNLSFIQRDRPGRGAVAEDFSLSSDTVSFAAGETQSCVVVTAVSDNAFDWVHEAFLDISEPSNGQSLARDRVKIRFIDSRGETNRISGLANIY